MEDGLGDEAESRENNLVGYCRESEKNGVGLNSAERWWWAVRGQGTAMTNHDFWSVLGSKKRPGCPSSNLTSGRGWKWKNKEGR